MRKRRQNLINIPYTKTKNMLTKYKRLNYLKGKLESKNYECDYGVLRRPLRRPPAEPARERCPLDSFRGPNTASQCAYRLSLIFPEFFSGN